MRIGTDYSIDTMVNRQEQSDELKRKITAILKEHQTEYQLLAEKTEKLQDEEQDLEKAYKILDQKTGLNALFEELARLQEGK